MVVLVVDVEETLLPTTSPRTLPTCTIVSNAGRSFRRLVTQVNLGRKFEGQRLSIDDLDVADYQRPSSRSAAEAYGTLINERERLRLNMRTVAYSLAQAAWVGRHFKNPDGTPLNYEEREATLYKNLHALAEDPRSLLLAPNVPVHETRGCCLLGSHSESWLLRTLCLSVLTGSFSA